MSTPSETAAKIIRRMGYPDNETGPYVTALRAYILKQCEKGMVGGSGGTWAPGTETLTYEERAKATMAFNWAADNYSYRVTNIDGPPWGYRLDLETMKRTFRVRWRRVPSWFGDQFRRSVNKLRVYWGTKVLKRTNPYL